MSQYFVGDVISGDAKFDGLRRLVPPGWRQSSDLIATIALIVVLWSVSDIGYYLLLPALGLQPSYNADPVAITLYYVFWIGIAVITFWPLYASWSLYGKWATFGNRLTSYLAWTASFAGCTLFAVYVLPLLPPTSWTQPWSPPEVRIATPWYFLPKSVDILFQQLLVAALVLALSARNYGIRKISIYCAALFGTSHILLAFGGLPFGYVIRFMVAASIFGFLFPYLILRVPNGFAYSYVVHWVYYAVTVAMPRIFLSTPT